MVTRSAGADARSKAVTDITTDAATGNRLFLVATPLCVAHAVQARSAPRYTNYTQYSTR
jgi:hypothetical protein